MCTHTHRKVKQFRNQEVRLSWVGIQGGQRQNRQRESQNTERTEERQEAEKQSTNLEEGWKGEIRERQEATRETERRKEQER
jgi:hypothetical protein